MTDIKINMKLHLQIDPCILRQWLGEMLIRVFCLRVCDQYTDYTEQTLNGLDLVTDKKTKIKQRKSALR